MKEGVDAIAEKFEGGTQNREIGNEIEEIVKGNNSSSALDIRNKYEKKGILLLLR